MKFSSNFNNQNKQAETINKQKKSIKDYFQKIQFIKTGLKNQNYRLSSRQGDFFLTRNSNFSSVQKQTHINKKYDHNSNKSLKTQILIDDQFRPDKRKLTQRQVKEFKQQINTQKYNVQKQRKNTFTNLSFYKSKSKTNKFTQTKYSQPKRRLYTQSQYDLKNKQRNQSCNQLMFNETNSLIKSTEMINLLSQEENNQQKEGKQQIKQQIKQKILQKISLYLHELGQKGQQELQILLTQKYLSRIRFHNERNMYEFKIKQMIQSNKQIVQILKKQFIQNRKAKIFKKVSNQSKQNQLNSIIDSSTKNANKNYFVSIQNNIYTQINQQAINCIDKQQSSKQILKIDRPNIDSSTEINQDILNKNGDLNQPTIQQNNQNQQGQVFLNLDLENNQIKNTVDKEQINKNYQNQCKAMTNQFDNQWKKLKVFKKTVYKKFRKSILEKFPQIKQRQNKARHDKLKQQIQSDVQSIQNENGEKNKVKLFQDTNLERQSFKKQNLNHSNQKIQSSLKDLQNFNKPNRKNNSNVISNQKLKLQNQKLKLNVNLKQNYNFRQNHGQNHRQNYRQNSNLKKYNINQKNKNKNTLSSPNKFQKQTEIGIVEQIKSLKDLQVLSKKNSISKKSHSNLQLFQHQDKQEANKINFANLVQFIFKRAFFYSISQKKVIQNKTPFNQVIYSPSVEDKNSAISFIHYSSKSKQKNYLKNNKLNQKRMNSTGRYLIKNKGHIMKIFDQGKKQYDYLKQCLDDAVQDYLKLIKKK